MHNFAFTRVKAHLPVNGQPSSSSYHRRTSTAKRTKLLCRYHCWKRWTELHQEWIPVIRYLWPLPIRTVPLPKQLAVFSQTAESQSTSADFPLCQYSWVMRSVCDGRLFQMPSQNLSRQCQNIWQTFFIPLLPTCPRPGGEGCTRPCFHGTHSLIN